MKTAIYTRQSIEKKDSVSIEAQIEYCKKVCSASDIVVYKDAGYSGANTERPDFEKMISDIQAGRINKVVAYRLDRISRSLSDFAGLIRLFEKHKVSFVSATEQFDTSSPVGRAMVYIIMVFAQLERETIAERIKDNYFHRAKSGLFLGGNCPLGYRGKRTTVTGKAASVLETDPKSSELVKMIFDMYVNKEYTLHKIVTALNQSSIKTGTGKPWLANSVRRILRNPVYAANTIRIYEYFYNNGYQVADPPSAFSGDNGCILAGKEKGKKNRTYTDTGEQVLCIGEHKPFIDDRIWLSAQYRLDKNKQNKRGTSGSITWLTGLTRCADCGYSISIKHSIKGGKSYYYMHCRGRSNQGESTCQNNTYFKLAEMEEAVEKELFQKVNFIDWSEGEDDIPVDPELLVRKNELTARILEINRKIDKLIDQMAEGVVGEYINKRIEQLDGEKKSLQSDLAGIDSKLHANAMRFSIKEYRETCEKIKNEWHFLDVKQKHLLLSKLADKIHISKSGNMHIDWVV